jgi:hypothetical protein
MIKLAKIKNDEIADIYESADANNFSEIMDLSKYVFINQDTVENAIQNNDYNIFLIQENDDNLSALYYDNDMPTFEKLTVDLLNRLKENV